LAANKKLQRGVIPYVGCDFEVKQNNSTSCPTGWRVPNYTEAKLMWAHRDGLGLLFEPYGTNFNISGQIKDGNCSNCTAQCCYLVLRPWNNECHAGYVYSYCVSDYKTICIR
jgi:hypothetical protein